MGGGGHCDGRHPGLGGVVKVVVVAVILLLLLIPGLCGAVKVVVVAVILLLLLVPGLCGVHVEGDHPGGQVYDGVLRHLQVTV